MSVFQDVEVTKSPAELPLEFTQEGWVTMQSVGILTSPPGYVSVPLCYRTPPGPEEEWDLLLAAADTPGKKLVGEKATVIENSGVRLAVDTSLPNVFLRLVKGESYGLVVMDSSMVKRL